MDLEVAVEKLGSMDRDEIVDMARELSCEHVPRDSNECLVANILSDMTDSENIAVSTEFAFKEMEPGVLLPSSLRLLIIDFDHGRITI